MSHTHQIELVAVLEGTSAFAVQIFSDGSLRILAGHDDRVWDVAWNPTMPLLSSCSTDRTIRIASYTPSQKNESTALSSERQEPTDFHNVSQIPSGHLRTVRALAWAPSGMSFVAASFDSTISIWERDKNSGDWESGSSLEGHETEVKGVAFNAEGTMLATCGRDKSVWIWGGENLRCLLHCQHLTTFAADFDDSEVLSVLLMHSQDVKSVAWHPTHDILASCSYDDTIKLYMNDPMDDWYDFATLAAHTSTVWDVAWSPCGRLLASVSDDRSIRIWRAKDHNLREWESALIIEGAHDRTVFSVSWGRSPIHNTVHASDGRGWLATTGSDGHVKVWDVKVGIWCCIYCPGSLPSRKTVARSRHRS